uniref:Uncharacterized protein n=1 Tax=Hucho hucho TaxID=62062 RepID=A0A4W5K1N9_9TELE
MVLYYDRIMDQAAVILRGYVIERFRAEGIQLSPEELGGTPNEPQGHELKEIVEQLLETTEELNTNTELQRLISEVSIFPYGINWGKVAVLHHLPYKLIHRAHTQNQPQVMVNIINDSTLCFWTETLVIEAPCFCIIIVAVAFKVGNIIYHLKGNVMTFIQVILICTLEVKVVLT